MAKNKKNKVQNNKFNAEFAEEFNQNNAAGKQAANTAQQKAEK
ncbi:MAG TPA: hypothetical protein VL921_16070 [Candidatus Udaeobacter sp.]|nr:hypothetical protein [Candidatus Udaeobacter sp.]